MKWSTAVAVFLVMVAPVPVVAGAVAYSIAVAHAIPWALRSA